MSRSAIAVVAASLFTQAAEFATGIGAERLIGISHSEDENDGVVTVRYWSDEGRRPQHDR